MIKLFIIITIFIFRSYFRLHSNQRKIYESTDIHRYFFCAEYLETISNIFYGDIQTKMIKIFIYLILIKE